MDVWIFCVRWDEERLPLTKFRLIVLNVFFLIASSYLVCLSLNTNLMARSFIFSDLSAWPLLQKCHVRFGTMLKY